ncbi:MAG TPA: dephospho-CoA kinase [Candidatus Mediterraneibacter gallistercoris]|uniref:Dephospho-CoA kinase n=1 Tax=Candidatus Mediterraneibacter gallistercoris TaxID=2838671 RepID=A0A9D2T2H3_9FIRM|nr:dephospho-CoA kinase [Candidatus Mediterraneibacter gallistercoris]
MKVIGITGGVGSGKSRVLAYLEEAYGAVICQMDETARSLQKKGTRCFERIVEVFGHEILDAQGELDRAALGSIVFASEEKLAQLNGIVHPEVIRHVAKDIQSKEAQGRSLYVVEAALLPDVGKELCDELWYIYADESARRERLKASRGYTDEKISQMIASQPQEERFRSTCSVVIDNSGSFEDTMKQIGDRLKL